MVGELCSQLLQERRTQNKPSNELIFSKMTDLPARDLDQIEGHYTENEFLIILKACLKRMTVHPSPQVVAMYMGRDGHREMGRCAIESVGYDRKTITLKNAGGEVIVVRNQELFFFDWTATQQSERQTLYKTMERLTVQQEEQRMTHKAQQEATEAQTALLKEQLLRKARESAMRTYVNTHVSMSQQFVDNWSIPDLDMKQFPRFMFAPRESEKKSAGYTTSETLQLLLTILHEALKIRTWVGAEHSEQRKSLCTRLAGNQYVTFFILSWMGSDNAPSHFSAFVIAMEDFISKHPAHDKLRLKLSQAHVVGPQVSTLTDDDAVSHGIKPAILGKFDGLPEDTTSTRNGLVLKLTKASKDGKSYISPSYETVLPSPPTPVNNSTKKKTWRIGGAPAIPKAPTAFPLSTTLHHSPPKSSRSGGGAPPTCETHARQKTKENIKGYKHVDMRPGARVRDVTLDLILRAVVAVYDSEVDILFPDHIRLFCTKGGEEQKHGCAVSLGSRPCIAPLLVRGDHWTVLYITSTEIVIRDSARTHTLDEAKNVAHELKLKVAALSKAKVVVDTKWMQQGYGSADCALFVIRAALQFVSSIPEKDTMQFFSRKDLDDMLPGDGKTVKKKLNQDVLHQFHVRMANYLGRPHPPPPKVHEQPLKVQAVTETSTPSPLDNPHHCRFGEHLGVDSTCGAVVKTKNAIQCCVCKALFCAKHASTWRDKATWRCQKCRPAHRTKGRLYDATDYSMPPPSSEEVSKVEEDFRQGQESPLLAHHAGKLIDELQNLKDIRLHPLAFKGVSKESRQDHKRMLQLISEAPVYQRQWPIARVALDALERGRVKFKWGWTTMGTKMGRMEGALHRLPLYTNEKVLPVRLRFEQEWKDAVTHVARLMAQYRATGLPSITPEEMDAAVLSATDEDVKALLILSWVFVARCGDMSQVKTDCLSVGDLNPKGYAEVRAHFERGKVIGKIDPYSLTTTVSKDWAIFLRAWLEKKKTIFLFQCSSAAHRKKFLAKARDHLRTIRGDLELKAIRRGAAQELAKQKVSLDQIRYFTKHKDVAMLRRYLKFGQAESEETRKGAEAGLKLLSKTS